MFHSLYYSAVDVRRRIGPFAHRLRSTHRVVIEDSLWYARGTGW